MRHAAAFALVLTLAGAARAQTVLPPDVHTTVDADHGINIKDPYSGESTRPFGHTEENLSVSSAGTGKDRQVTVKLDFTVRINKDRLGEKKPNDDDTDCQGFDVVIS